MSDDPTPQPRIPESERERDPRSTAPTAKITMAASPVTVLLFIAPSEVTDAAQLAATIVRALAERPNSSLTIDVAEHIPHPLAKLDEDGTPIAMEVSSHTLLLIVRGRGSATARAASDLLEAGSDHFDRSTSFVIAGEEVVIKPGSGSFSVVMPVRRLPHFNRPSFQHRWRTIHADFGRRMAAPGYRQVHAAALSDDAG
ncbi:MAG TPA: hypothetical protein VNG12_23340, partial [Acidimicrobiales bacterium]|nr:hypothetical protein [Acidimicrobiales bacterium]